MDVKARVKKWRKAHPLDVKEYRSRWKKTHKPRVRLYEERTKLRKALAAARPDLTPHYREELIDKKIPLGPPPPTSWQDVLRQMP